MIGGYASGSVKSAENIFWQRDSGMSCAATNAARRRHFKTSGSLTNEPEKITMIYFIKMSARTGATKSTGQRIPTAFQLTVWKKYKLPLLTSRKKHRQTHILLCAGCPGTRGMSCAATSAEKHRRFKTSGNLTRGQEKITMTCFKK